MPASRGSAPRVNSHRARSVVSQSRHAGSEQVAAGRCRTVRRPAPDARSPCGAAGRDQGPAPRSGRQSQRVPKRHHRRSPPDRPRRERNRGREAAGGGPTCRYPAALTTIPLHPPVPHSSHGSACAHMWGRSTAKESRLWLNDGMRASAPRKVHDVRRCCAPGPRTSGRC